ncbi:MAG: NAD-dependent epimerase/dehydratase family protein [Candidatus Rokuibacteriota bacterium]
MARALILGGAGFVGYHLATRLAGEGYAVTLVDDLSRGRRDPELAALRARPGVEWLEADLTRPSALDPLRGGWDHVYLLAAVVGVRNVTADPARVIRVNTAIVLNVLDWLADRGATLFFASTSETYAGGVAAGGLPVPTPEDVPLSIPDIREPRFAYAASKIVGEAAVLHTARARGFRAVVGRLHNVYGPRMGADHVIPEVALRALRREDPFRVWGGGQHRAFCHVADAVEAIVRLVGAEAAWGQVVNVGNDAEETRIDDLVGLVLRVAGVAPRLERLPAPPGSVDRRCPDLGRLRALTGFTPKVSLEAGVRETFEWYRTWWLREEARR